MTALDRSMNTRRVLISHPHAAAFAVESARALARHGLLNSFVTGIGAARDSRKARLWSMLTRRVRTLQNRLLDGIGYHQLHALTGVELAARGLGQLLSTIGTRQAKPYDAMFVMHDWAVSLMPWENPDLVYAYEDAALRTFRKAKGLGIVRVWDLPVPHHRTLEEMWREESRRWPGAMGAVPPVEPEWKIRRKDEELSLASAVFVASSFTRQSLEHAGYAGPVSVVPYGFPVDAFPARQRAPSGPFTVLSVGTQDLRKGTPYLLEAWKRAKLPDSRLRLIGPMRLERRFLDDYQDVLEHVPHLPKATLGEEYRKADLLVFPTLGDGFGLVMQEAMSSGLPVLTTPCGGGPECITDGQEGWIIPPADLDALVERLREAHGNRHRLVVMGQAARKRAEAYDWRSAGNLFVREIETCLYSRDMAPPS